MPVSPNLLTALNLDETADALARLFPGIKPTPLHLLDEGFSSFVIETAAGIVFRIARHAAAGAAYFREKATLPELAPHLPLAIPHPAWFAAADPAFPYGILGYPKLPGRAIASSSPNPAADLTAKGFRLDHIAADAGSFLAALHRVPPAALPSVELQLAHQRRADWEGIRAECLPALVGPLTPDEYYRFAGWWDEFLSDSTLDDYTPTLRHGDFWYGNLLVDERDGNVAAVLDFERLAASDPADDFAAQYHLGDDFAAEVFELYHEAGGTRDPALPRRAQRLWEIRHFEGLRWAIRFGDAKEFTQSVEKLRAGPILNQ